MKNRLITIGFLGDISCYLNVPKEEAIARYVAENPSYAKYIDNGDFKDFIGEFYFDDKFWAYSACAAND